MHDLIKQNTDNEISTKWIENLALEEINMEESGIISMNDHLDPSLLLEESSIDFMDSVRDRFEIYVNKFNQYRGNSKSNALIKIFKISNTVNDFMLFRNSLRLIIARQSFDLITIGLLANGKDLFAARLNSDDTFGGNQVHEIRAHLGPFNNISWRFSGEEVNVDSLVRHYLSEFIRNSGT